MQEQNFDSVLEMLAQQNAVQSQINTQITSFVGNKTGWRDLKDNRKREKILNGYRKQQAFMSRYIYAN